MCKILQRKRALTCQQVEAQLMAYLKEGLSVARQEGIREHLATCDACARAVYEAQALEAGLVAEAAHRNPALSHQAVARIQERVYRRMRRGLIVQRLTHYTGRVAGAALLLALAVALFVLVQGRSLETDKTVGAQEPDPVTATPVATALAERLPTNTPTTPTLTPTPVPSSTPTSTPTAQASATLPSPATAWPTPTLPWSGPSPTPEMGAGSARTRHLNITYPEGAESQVEEFLAYAEDVYRDVDYFFDGALPTVVNVTLTTESGSHAAWGDITVSLQYMDAVEQIYAHELVHIATREIVGEPYEEQAFGFFSEGLAAWVEERYERKQFAVESRMLWAAFAYTQGWAELYRMESWNEFSQEIDGSIAYAVGYSFVSHFINLYGRDELLELLAAMSQTENVRAALSKAGFNPYTFIESWQTRLKVEADKHDFSRVPQVEADLILGGGDETCDVSVRVHIVNPETAEYEYYISYHFGDAWTENSYPASGNDFETLMPLGQVQTGTKVLWDVVVRSRTLNMWVKSGWQEKVVRCPGGASAPTLTPISTATAEASPPANAWPTPTPASEPTPTPQMSAGHARTPHLDITHPEDEGAQVEEFLNYAEDVYADVNYFFNGVLPQVVNVTLVSQGSSKTTEDGLMLSLEHGNQVEQIYAHELAHVAHREIVGEPYEEPAFSFFNEGLGAWVEERYERKTGQQVEPRWRWAAFAYTQGWTELEIMEQWEQFWRVNPSVSYAVGYTFVSHFIDLYGQEGLMALSAALADNADMCAALDAAGFDCASFVESWHAALDDEAAQYDFGNLPQVEAELVITGEGELRDVSVRVHIVNPEYANYSYYVSYVLGQEWLEQGRWEEHTYSADSSDFETVIPLGQVKAGDKAMWDAIVWSDTLRTWVKSGWQEEVIP